MGRAGPSSSMFIWNPDAVSGFQGEFQADAAFRHELSEEPCDFSLIVALPVGRRAMMILFPLLSGPWSGLPAALAGDIAVRVS